MEARVRRGDLLDDEAVFAFYDERCRRRRHVDPALRPLVEGRRRERPELLDLTDDVLAGGSGFRIADYPDRGATASSTSR